jgi:hypothetical protein
MHVAVCGRRHEDARSTTADLPSGANHDLFISRTLGAVIEMLSLESPQHRLCISIQRAERCVAYLFVKDGDSFERSARFRLGPATVSSTVEDKVLQILAYGCRGARSRHHSLLK